MLSRDTRDPAALPRLLLTLLALALLWPGIRLSELDLGVLLQADSQSEMGRFVAAFWPPSHDTEFLRLLLDATLQTLAIATAGMALALLLAIPASLLASRALSLSAASRGGRPKPLAQLLHQAQGFGLGKRHQQAVAPGQQLGQAVQAAGAGMDGNGVVIGPHKSVL